MLPSMAIRILCELKEAKETKRDWKLKKVLTIRMLRLVHSILSFIIA
jgi:hypothetical protein